MSARILGLHFRAIVLAAACASEAFADCTCRALGRDFELGRSICLATPGGSRLATCGLVLNNTSWSISSTPCVVSSLAPVGSGDQRSVRIEAVRPPGG
jgi:hypothetical protein